MPKIPPIVAKSLNEELQEVFKVVGMLMHNATGCEQLMCTALEILAGTSARVASDIFYASDSIQIKKTMLHRVADSVGDTTDQDLIKQIIGNVSQVQSQRNDLSHAMLVSDPGNPVPSELYNPKKDTLSPITKTYLMERRRQCAEGCAKALEAFQKLCVKHGRPQTETLSSNPHDTLPTSHH